MLASRPFIAYILATIALMFCGGAASAQAPLGGRSTPQGIVEVNRAKWMRRLAHPEAAGGDLAWQAAATVGREDMFSQLNEMARKKNYLPWHEQKTCGVAVAGDPIAEIVRRARETSVVVISEYHDEPRDRAFAARVVRALRTEGYAIFAAETLFHDVDASTPEALLTDGIYSEEPAYGAELALVKRLGYRLVPYEITEAQGEQATNADDRERIQAENLMAAIFKSSRRAKVIIHAGGSYERSNPGADYHDMVEHLKRLTGIDPLTINQRDCASSTGSVVLAAGFDPPGPTRSDLFVGQPPLTFKDGRPAWRQEAGQKPVPVPPPFLAANEPIIVEARPVGTLLQIVPTDRLYLKPGEQLPLLLAPGQYRVDAWTASGPFNSKPERVTVQ